MPRRYSEFNGQPFRFQSDIDLAGSLFEFVLAYGPHALESLRNMQDDPEQSELLQQLLDQGLLDKVRGRFRLTPRAVDAMQRTSLMEIFAQLKSGPREGHDAPQRGGPGERVEGTRPFEWGDPVSEIDLNASLRNALRRSSLSPEHDAAPRSRLPMRLQERDFERFDTESRTSCSTVVLLDLSGSMARAHRYLHAKKCALALIALIRQRFPFDTVDVFGFATGVEPIEPERLPLLMPKPITRHDPVIRMRVPLPRLADAPPHFTNLHLGLMQADRTLRRRPGENRLIFVITDGQPTAHIQGDYAVLQYPPGEDSRHATLRAAYQIARRGVRICTFALADDYWDMDWLGFADELGKVTRGITYHCAGGDLGAVVMQSYLGGRAKRTFSR